jgi:hypothetical protein
MVVITATLAKVVLGGQGHFSEICSKTLARVPA